MILQVRNTPDGDIIDVEDENKPPESPDPLIPVYSVSMASPSTPSSGLSAQQFPSAATPLSVALVGAAALTYIYKRLLTPRAQPTGTFDDPRWDLAR